MTSQMTLWGEVTSALDLLVPVGLTAVLDEGGWGPASFFWDADSMPSRARVSCPAPSVDDMAEAVRRHAARHTLATSWVQARIERTSNAGKGLFSPRASIKPQDWDDYLDQRATWLTTHGHSLTELDWAMIAGLGEPAWWRAADKDAQPDKGASRWEMKTRNRGEEFITHRLQPLALAVSQRTVDGIRNGLTTGPDVIDECGDNRPKSLTATGLTPPQPTDNVKAWLALWGLCALPTVPIASGALEGFSQSPGVWPRTRVHPRSAALPIVRRPYGWRSYRTIMTSRAFDSAARRPVADSLQERSWLQEQGVIAIANLPILKVGSDSAPERRVLSATIEVLTHV